MKKFIILDEKGEAVPIQELDRLAAEFWDVQQIPNMYTSPKLDLTNVPEEKRKIQELLNLANNWCDVIGWSIYQTKTDKDWDIVKENIKEYPSHCQLCDYWASMGYKPKGLA